MIMATLKVVVKVTEEVVSLGAATPEIMAGNY
jgi:hypothetical protein